MIAVRSAQHPAVQTEFVRALATTTAMLLASRPAVLMGLALLCRRIMSHDVVIGTFDGIQRRYITAR